MVREPVLYTGRCPGVSGTAPQDNTDETCAPQRWLECGCLGWAPGELATYLVSSSPHSINISILLTLRKQVVHPTPILPSPHAWRPDFPGAAREAP